MKPYKFTAQCKSGEWKEFQFEAANYSAARKKLQELIEEN